MLAVLQQCGGAGEFTGPCHGFHRRICKGTTHSEGWGNQPFPVTSKAVGRVRSGKSVLVNLLPPAGTEGVLLMFINGIPGRVDGGA